MPPPFQRQTSVTVTGDVTLTLATEVVVATLNGISVADPNAGVHLRGVAHVSTGAGATTVTPRIRRGSLTGTLLGEADAVNVVASNIVTIFDELDDVPGDVASQVYVFTLTAAGAAGVCLNSSFIALLG